MNIEVQDKVSRKELEKMRVGSSQIFNLINGGKVKSAMTTCQQMKNEKKMEFKAVPDWEHNAICITRLK